MGSSKFRISDMMPNSWFYKLKNMGKGRTTRPKRQPKSTAPIEPSNSKLTKQPPTPPPKPSHRNLSAPQARKSYHFSRQEGICAANSPRLSQSNYPDPPRKSTRRKSTGRSRRMSLLASGRRVPSPASSCAAGCSCSDRHTAAWAKPDLTTPEYSISTSPFDSSPETKIRGRPLLPEFRSDAILPTESSVSWSSTCSCGTSANSAPNDIEMDAKSFTSNNKFDVISELDLAPIVTKKTGDFKNRSPGTGRTLAGHYSPGMRLRLNSPKIASRRIQALSGGRRSVSSSSTTCSARLRRRRRSVSDSFAVVKASKDPKSDFRESMVEMIMQNNIWDSKDLEELLACYLSLNSDEYHGVIISVFKQIWHDLTVTDDARVK